MGAAPIIRATFTAWMPSPPTPQMPTASPGATLARSVIAAYGVETASARIAACSIGIESGTATSAA